MVRAALRAIDAADTVLIVGTSLVVYPAAAYVRYFSGEHLVLINKTPTSQDYRADLLIEGAVGQILGQIEVR